MNAAVLMFTACLAGAEPVPTAQPYGPVPVVVYGNGGGYGDCCGRASVCGNCDAHQCCLTKLWSKLSCFSLNLCDKGNGCNSGHTGCNLCNRGQQTCAPACNPCPKPACNPCPKPVCNPCPKPVCNPCPKPVCNPCPKVECPKPACNPCPKPACNPCSKPVSNPCPKPECPKPVCTKVQPDCHTSSCGQICWTPGYCLHKCKEKLSGLCGGHGAGCHGGCGTAATPNACGSTVIAPGTAVPVGPAPVVPKSMPEAPKTPVKVGSAYGIVRPSLTTDDSIPRTIDLTPNPF